MKSPWAKASIFRRGMAGLKFQSKVLKGSASRKRASLMRRSMRRWRRRPAWSASRRWRNSRCELPASWACFKTSSSWSAVTGTRKVVKSARICSRRVGAVGLFVRLVFWLFFARWLIGVLGGEQMLVVAGRTWADRFLAQARIESILVQVGEFVQERFGFGLRRQDAADGGQGEGAEADRTLQRLQHIVTLVMR